MSKKRNDIQGVRAWAIILVLLFHFFPAFIPNGYVGVDMFFVVSGFLMAMIISKNEDINIAVFRSFYYRRIKRILPLYYLVVLFILMVIVLVLPSSFRTLNLQSSRKAIFLISNFRETEDVNQRYENMLVQAEDLFTHTWSLSVEMQWYLLVPIVYVIQRLLTAFERLFFSGVAAISLVLYSCIELDAAFYNVFARIWQFSCGILAYSCNQKEKVYPGKLEPESAKTGLNNEPQNKEATAKKGIKIPKVTEVLTWVFFILAIAVPFIVIPLPARFLRVETTIATAILIYLGKQHQTVLLTKPEIVYIGDISYAFYLFHWPVHIVVNYYYSGNPLGPFFGIFVSGLLAALTYTYYERVYLSWSPPMIAAVLLTLFCGCIFLSLQPVHVDDFDLDKMSIDLNKVDVRDAAWNMTLMRYIIAKERHPAQHMWHKGCNYSDRFLNQRTRPKGFCSMKRGGGKVNFLVIGNSFACNQGDVVYEAFKVHANEFNIFCLSGCEFWLQTYRHCDSLMNFTSVIEELKPDVVFIMNRHLLGKERFDPTKPLSEDVFYRNQTRFLDYLEKVVKKVYILQAIPRCVHECPLPALKHTQKGVPLNTIKDGLIVKDDFFARQRMWEIGRRCKRCQIVDYKSVLVDENGEFLGYDPKTNLMYFDVYNHLNRFGKERIQIVFNRLSKEFSLPEKT